MKRIPLLDSLWIAILVSCSGQKLPEIEEAHETAQLAESATPSMPPPLSHMTLSTSRETCRLADETLEVALPRPEDFIFHCDPTEEAARIYSGALNPMEADLLIQVFVIHPSESGPEYILNETGDVARRWLLSIGLMGPSARSLNELAVTVDGEETTAYSVLGLPPGLRTPREGMVLHLRRSSHNIIVMALHAQEDVSSHRQALTLIQGITFH